MVPHSLDLVPASPNSICNSWGPAQEGKDAYSFARRENRPWPWALPLALGQPREVRRGQVPPSSKHPSVLMLGRGRAVQMFTREFLIIPWYRREKSQKAQTACPDSFVVRHCSKAGCTALSKTKSLSSQSLKCSGRGRCQTST